MQAETVTQSCSIQVMVMMMKGSNSDLFTPAVWVSEKAKVYWLGIAAQDLWKHTRFMEAYCVGTLDSKITCLSADTREGNWQYSASNGVGALKLTIWHGVKINMTNYPGVAVDGWKSGKIKWVTLTTEEIEQQKEELASLELEAAQAQSGNSGKSQTMYIDQEAF
ncbi:uncharacterized protein EI90DRAFT_3013123 [Cantharellus anzutake]|uniref:uncharacterized protein n=1 Tax=Cantharellus anzutake TaxID=1750568 RepID=UPI001906D782|nr:uncharacterized protein EI90DRAFT_3013123 [Cantharellus anzutake]KAF8339051.1 hypothetical protein EI90DRAFT_3013123 [Cantharellus anzutake]